MLECGGYKMFRGPALIRPKTTNFCPMVVRGTFLYKPETDCWYVGGASYPASVVESITENKDDVRPVVRGQWVMVKPRYNGRNATYKCIACGKLRSSYYNDVQEWSFCPCGADMRNDS